MRIGPQVYVRGSIEAAELYCKAFNAEISFQIKNEEDPANIQYAHCELSVDGEVFLALSEAPPECDTSPKTAWQTMAFNVCLGNEAAVRRAFEALSEGGTVIDGPGPCDWNAFCSNLIDKYGVFWWIAI